MGSLLGRQKPRPETKGSSVRFRDLLLSHIFHGEPRAYQTIW